MQSIGSLLGPLILLAMARLGQHITVDSRVLNRLVELAAPTSDDVVLEPGCGDGRLTELLVRKGCRVISVEIDPTLFEEASRRLSGWKNVTIIRGDLLKIKPRGFTMSVGSPPYYLSRRLIEWLTTEAMPRKIVLVLQKEFAEKLVAPPGSSNYLFISLVSQMLYDVELHERVSPASFRPPPKVVSCIATMSRNNVPPPEPCYFKILKQIFTDRRHKLGKILGKLGYTPNPPHLANKRVYELTPREALTLVNSLAKSEAGAP